MLCRENKHSQVAEQEQTLEDNGAKTFYGSSLTPFSCTMRGCVHRLRTLPFLQRRLLALRIVPCKGGTID